MIVLGVVVIVLLASAMTAEKMPGGSSWYYIEAPGKTCNFDVQRITSDQSQNTGSNVEVSYTILKDMLSSRSIQLLDVRNPDEFQCGHVHESTNIPLCDLQEALKLTPDQFKQRYGMQAPQTTDTDIVLYCQSGCRSAIALDIMRSMGFKRARHYVGGYVDWTQHEHKCATMNSQELIDDCS